MQDNSGESGNQGGLRHDGMVRQISLRDHMSELEKTVDTLEQFFDDALKMFNVHTTNGLIEFVIARFRTQFVPEHLLFVIEDSANAAPETSYFSRLNPGTLPEPASWYNELKETFPPTGRPLVIEGTSNPLSPALAGSLKPYNVNLIIPLKGIGGIFGFVLFSGPARGSSYTGEEITYINRIMRFFSVGMQNTLHHQSSITDLKTGLFNHMYFTRRLEEELFRGRRYNTETAILLMDIDFFKNLNDTYGHLAGDIVLQELARTMKSKLRVEDILSRFGGEEFTLLLPTTSTPMALEIAERLRVSIENMRVNCGEKNLSITISMGCAVSGPDRPLVPQQLIAHADEALYHSKRNGRNRVTLYSPDGYIPSARP